MAVTMLLVLRIFHVLELVPLDLSKHHVPQNTRGMNQVS